MAFRLTKAEQKRRDELASQLSAVGSELEDAVAEFNEKLGSLLDTLHTKIVAYNDVVSEASEWRDELVADREGEYEEKSERWQDGEQGSAARAWIDEWEALELDVVEIEPPEEIEELDLAHSDTLTNAPEAA